mmetsp:Transcript_23209/g.65586  ORF Transcript_23209/g.65586 Transcript_23209/m.65586 type:complete len:237 (+) Transcript_23209:592-1302(+)
MPEACSSTSFRMRIAETISMAESASATDSKERGSASCKFLFSHCTCRLILPVGSTCADARPPNIAPPTTGGPRGAFSAAVITNPVGSRRFAACASTSFNICMATVMSRADSCCTTSENEIGAAKSTCLFSQPTCLEILPVESNEALTVGKEELPSDIITPLRPPRCTAFAAAEQIHCVGLWISPPFCSNSFKIAIAIVTSIRDKGSTTSEYDISSVRVMFLFSQPTCRPIFPVGST